MFHVIYFTRAWFIEYEKERHGFNDTFSGFRISQADSSEEIARTE